jgi:hypothetical protein
MLNFESYPIYINHPGAWEKVRQRQIRDFVGDAKMRNWLAHTGRHLYEIQEDTNPSYESREYEYQVHRLLRLIGSTRVGRLLFDSLNRSVKHWIVPLDSYGKGFCNCRAYTFPGAPKEGGGVRVYFNPKDSHSIIEKWLSADDVLFHELVHAYRIGRVGYFGQNTKRMNDYDDAEEFLALHMQNVYLANRNSPRFYRDYSSLRSVSKGTAYQYFASDAEVLMAFRHFVEHEPLAGAVAQWRNPPDSFNPWRDQPVLERIWRSDSEVRLERLPEF